MVLPKYRAVVRPSASARSSSLHGTSRSPRFNALAVLPSGPDSGFIYTEVETLGLEPRPDPHQTFRHSDMQVLDPGVTILR